MLKKLNKKGFTLAELLIVVAIIGVLVAISIPIFTAQLAKARLATNQANARAAYAAAVAAELEKDATANTANFSYKYVVSTATATKDSSTATVSTNKAISDWETTTSINGKEAGAAVATEWQIIFTKDGSYAGATCTWPTTS